MRARDALLEHGRVPGQVDVEHRVCALRIQPGRAGVRREGGTSDAGTQITVTPQITDGDRLLIDYQVSLSSFVGEASDVTLSPPRQQNSLTSVATVPDGFAVVVGGLEVEQETESASKVPLLGDLPILGALFRSKTRTMTKTRFFVFLR